MGRTDDFATEFAKVGAWIEAYYAHPERFDVFPNVRPGEIEAQLPAQAPVEGESFDAILEDFEKLIVPGITHWNHPRFFAYFSTSAIPIAVMAEALAATLDVKVMLWRTSPSASELEDVVMRWLGQLLGIAPSWKGIIYDTASVAGFTALAAAREALNLGIREQGMSGRDLPPLRIYITEHTHSHVEKAAIALGIGTNNVVKVPCDAQFRMDPGALERLIEEDTQHGYRPMAIVATVGTTSTTSIDPVAKITEIAKRYDVWLHVDAAYAGPAAILPEQKHLMDGVDQANSLVLNPHKWLYVPMDLSVLYLRDEAILRRGFSLVPEYLTTTDGDVRNYMDYGLQLGRRFRALKLWFVMRHLGVRGMQEHLRSAIALAQTFARWVDDAPDWEVTAPHPLSVVCFRYRPSGVTDEAEIERANAAILEAVNATGEVFLSHTKILGRYMLRLAIGNYRTTEADIRAAWEIAQREAKRAVAAR